jgi:hypothetical protein
LKIIQKKYTLVENALIFLNESLTNAKNANKYSKYWIFAILHIVQSIELMSKEILKQQHPFLIFEDIDNPKNTVTFKQAIDRLQKIVKIDFDTSEFTMLNRAYELRNQITHHEYDFNNAHFSDIYRKLFEFMTYFYEKHFHTELHNQIQKDLYPIEASIIAKFNRDFITYQGSLMSVLNPIDIIEYQKLNGLLRKDGKVFERIKCGFEGEDYWPLDMEICGDCGVKKGQYHTDGCDIEQCPICGNQLLSCDCEIYDYVEV